MQKTLFLYIFRDLLRVFLLASGAIAGIMSFGGLLRPLTQHGLDIGQVGQMLGYFMPAMTNYSWPIAVLFATTFVYGRLSADNELTACRAAGMNYFQILTPAILIGVVVTLLSVTFLCFVVPRSFLKAERVVYSNLAKLVAGEIDRTQRIRLDAAGQQTTIFARKATVLDPEPTRPQAQAVDLDDVTIVTYVKGDALPKVPAEFYLAERATAVITMPRDGDGDVSVKIEELLNGRKIPNPGATTPDGSGGSKSQVSAVITSGSAGPFTLASPVRETTKFMDIFRLLDLRASPERSRKVTKEISTLARVDQTREFLRELAARLGAGEAVTLTGTDAGSNVRYVIGPAPGAHVRANAERLMIVAGTTQSPAVPVTGNAFDGKAREIQIVARPNPATSSVYATIDIRDAVLESDGQTTPTLSKEFNVAVPMSERVARLSQRTAVEYLRDPSVEGMDRGKELRTVIVRQQNNIESELNARVSFAFSCFLLALVGAMIGMMTRSGNFVTAFAVSVGPALVAIVLIVTGQHIAEAMPRVSSKGIDSPLNLGLAVMWSGSAIVIALGIGLYARLSRT